MEFDCIPILSVGIEDVIIPGAQASGDLRWMHATRYQRILRSIVCHLPGNAAEALRRNEPDFRSARLIVLSLESCHTGSQKDALTTSADSPLDYLIILR